MHYELKYEKKFNLGIPNCLPQRQKSLFLGKKFNEVDLNFWRGLEGDKNLQKTLILAFEIVPQIIYCTIFLFLAHYAALA